MWKRLLLLFIRKNWEERNKILRNHHIIDRQSSLMCAKLSLLKKENTHIDKCLSLSRIHKNHMHSHMSKSVFYRFQENFIVNTLKRKATKIRFWYYHCYDRLKTLKTLNRGSQFCSIRVIMCSKHSFYTIKRIYKYFWTHFTFFCENEWMKILKTPHLTMYTEYIAPSV